MAFTPIQGSDGRLMAITVAANLSLPMPVNTGTAANIDGITKWVLMIEDNHGDPIHHFESSATAYGMLWGEQIQGGVQTYKVDIEGYIDLDSTSTYADYTLFNNGAIVRANLIYDKTVATGLYGLMCKISNWRTAGPEVKGGPVKFSCTLLGHGALPALSVT
jgi:hypothetical protein